MESVTVGRNGECDCTDHADQHEFGLGSMQADPETERRHQLGDRVCGPAVMILNLGKPFQPVAT
jgi:hypothetical protein